MHSIRYKPLSASYHPRGRHRANTSAYTQQSSERRHTWYVHFFWFIFHSGGYLGRRIDRGSLPFAPVQPRPGPVLSGFPREVEERRRPGDGRPGPEYRRPRYTRAGEHDKANSPTTLMTFFAALPSLERKFCDGTTKSRVCA